MFFKKDTKHVYGFHRRPLWALIQQPGNFLIPIPEVVLPPKIDLRTLVTMPPAYNQGNLGSCSAQAIAGAIEFSQDKQSLPNYVPSRLFIYYYERAIQGTVDTDSGAMLPDGMAVLNGYGYVPETDWPYDISKFAVKPPDALMTIAAKAITSQYASVPHTMSDIKGALAQGFPLVFGIICYTSLESESVARTGIVPMPGRWMDRQIGGHAILLMGYDDSKKRFMFRNSWGPEWGDKGYGYLPYDYVMRPDLASDFWVIRQIVS